MSPLEAARQLIEVREALAQELSVAHERTIHPDQVPGDLVIAACVLMAANDLDGGIYNTVDAISRRFQ